LLQGDQVGKGGHEGFTWRHLHQGFSKGCIRLPSRATLGLVSQYRIEKERTLYYISSNEITSNEIKCGGLLQYTSVNMVSNIGPGRASAAFIARSTATRSISSIDAIYQDDKSSDVL